MRDGHIPAFNTLLQLERERRRIAFLQVDAEMGLQAFSVEKDFWVCWTLRELFNLPGIGGTPFCQLNLILVRLPSSSLH